MINNIINHAENNIVSDSNNRELAYVFYADTDSLIVNQTFYNMMLDKLRDIVSIDLVDLGAMKNEYPLNNDQYKTAITNLRVYNKKIYQYMIDG